MTRFKKWLAGVWSAARVDEKKLSRYVLAVGALAATAGYQVFDVGVSAILAMTAKELAHRFAVCFAMGLLGALARGGPIKAISLTAVADLPALPKPTATAPAPEAKSGP